MVAVKSCQGIPCSLLTPLTVTKAVSVFEKLLSHKGYQLVRKVLSQDEKERSPYLRTYDVMDRNVVTIRFPMVKHLS